MKKIFIFVVSILFLGCLDVYASEKTCTYYMNNVTISVVLSEPVSKQDGHVYRNVKKINHNYAGKKLSWDGESIDMSNDDSCPAGLLNYSSAGDTNQRLTACYQNNTGQCDFMLKSNVAGINNPIGGGSYGSHVCYFKSAVGNNILVHGPSGKLFFNGKDTKLEINSISDCKAYKYILLKDGKYNFNSNIDSNSKYDEIFISSSVSTGNREELESTCGAIVGSDLLSAIKSNLGKIWLFIPIIVIVFTSFDFAKVVFNDDKDGMNKAFKNLKTRLIVAAIIVLLPSIFVLVADVFGQSDVQECVNELTSHN